LQKIWTKSSRLIHRIEDADIVVVSYGVSARTALAAVEDAPGTGYQGRVAQADHRMAVSFRTDRIGRRVKGFVTVEQVWEYIWKCSGPWPGKPLPILWGMPAGPDFREQVMDVMSMGFEATIWFYEYCNLLLVLLLVIDIKTENEYDCGIGGDEEQTNADKIMSVRIRNSNRSGRFNHKTSVG
jgi:hypothetical protein